MNPLATIPAKSFTISAALLGYLLIDDYNPAEQNSLGNWFMLVGQILCTNASQQQVINNANKTSAPSNRHIINNDNVQVGSSNEQIIIMQEMINELKKEIDILKRT